VYRSVSRGEILRLKPGLFLLTEEFRKSHSHPFAIAALLHSPSHVSLESALSYHGLIPEAVHQISSVTYSRSRTFKTPVGVFTYQHVPANNPRAGVETLKLDKQSWAFVATPLRAIADLVYLRKEVNWKRDGLAFLTESMRIDIEDLRHVSIKRFDEVSASFRNKRIKEYLFYLNEEITK
jgi:predicted transcriptional regulator of viral defense system